MALPTLEREVTSQGVGDTASSMRLAPSNLGEVFRRADLSDDLAAIEHILLQRTASNSRLLAAAGAHTVAAGGKRLRAALVLLAARLGEYQLVRAARPAVAIELLHAASLVHDDLVDHTLRRRGRVTVHARWDSHVALMLGDYFFAVSANELAAEPDPRIIRFYADAAHTVVEGELRPVTQLEPIEIALAQYRYKIGCKTAALFEAACKAGIAVAGGAPEQIEALGKFGYDLGLAFQIVDDVLDFTGDEATLGKPAGNDLREGTLTLPLIYAVAQDGSPLLREVARTARPDPTQVPQLVAAVLAAGGAERAMGEARQTAERAIEHLSGFAPSSVMHALSDICDFVLNRQV
ncbi:MAG TPA: polyprenyl synthetase family protein [Roseiflexaceae bacterium]|nr:polyprenyl synthetase family protein [Roseiflexaceae bacterium]